MSHNVFGKKLNRDTGQRQALLKGLAGAIIRSESIETTEAKAKAAKDLIEKLITHAKRGTVSDLRQIEAAIISKELVDKLVHDIAPRFASRAGGYLRLTKTGIRAGDNASMVRMEFVAASAPKVVVPKVAAPKTAKEPKKAAPKKAPAKKVTKKV